MPIYEYWCASCQRKVSIFYRSFSTVEAPVCPRCGGSALTRAISRVAVLRHGSGEAASGGSDGDDLDPTGMLAGLDENDPRAVARWARQMSAEMGEPLEPEFDTALTRIERGEDPDRVMEEVDGESGPLADDGGGGDDGF
jgi:putative FmdB family regulatory protein